jgi:hypothetical protein
MYALKVEELSEDMAQAVLWRVVAQQLFLRLLHPRTCGFNNVSLDCWVLYI